MLRKHDNNHGFFYNFIANIFDMGGKLIKILFIRSLFRRR